MEAPELMNYDDEEEVRVCITDVDGSGNNAKMVEEETKIPLDDKVWHIRQPSKSLALVEMEL